MNLYTSDLHFGHRDILAFDHRPFCSIAEMEQVMIKLWNSRVQNDDEVYIVGDVFCENEKDECWYLRQLRGHKHLIKGNHDDKLLQNDRAMSYFESVHKIVNIMDRDKEICLCHEPQLIWDGQENGAWHIYGHVHGMLVDEYKQMRDVKNALNAGCMVNNYTPASFNELIRNNKEWKNKWAKRFTSQR